MRTSSAGPILISLVLVMVGVSSCEVPTGTKSPQPTITSIVPVIAFNSEAASRSVIGSEMTKEDATFFFFCPGLTGLATRQGGVSEGEVIAAQPFLNTSISFAASSFNEGVNGIAAGVRFQGDFADGSGWITVEVSTDETRFWYEQVLFIEDPHKLIDPNKPQKTVFRQVISGTMDASDLSMIGTSDFGYYTISSDGSTETRVLVVAPTCEFYSGPWEASDPGTTGAGLVTLRVAISFAPEGQYGGVSAPASTYATFNASAISESLRYIEAYKLSSPTLYSQRSLLYRTSSDAQASILQGSGWTGVSSAETAKDNLPSSLWRAVSSLHTFDY